VDASHLHAGLYLLAFEVREADESDLAVLHDVIECTHRLLERGQPIRPVHEVDVEPVGAEILQGLVDRREDAVAAAVSEVRLVPVVHAELADDDGVLSAPAQSLTQRPLRRAHAIALGRVEATDAEVERTTDRRVELASLDAS